MTILPYQYATTMPDSPLKANTHALIECQHIGREQQPVLIIDNFLSDPESLIELAASAEFRADGGLFPGHRAPAPALYTQVLEQALPSLLAETFGTRAGDIRQVESSYSLVTQPPESLKPLQRIPHFDSRKPQELASIYFLCNQQQQQYGGTAFYRHKSTGFESVDDTRFATYMSALEQDAKHLGLPDADYIRSSTPVFEQIDRFDAVFNRLLVYRCTSLHSGVIPSDFNFDRNPRTARLSINSFLVG